MGILGAIGRNPNLSDSFLYKIMSYIMRPIKTSSLVSATAFNRFRNLKSLGKNLQASGEFVRSLTDNMLELGKSIEKNRVKQGLEEYIAEHPNAPKDVLLKGELSRARTHRNAKFCLF